jgi:hypothetical protein
VILGDSQNLERNEKRSKQVRNKGIFDILEVKVLIRRYHPVCPPPFRPLSPKVRGGTDRADRKSIILKIIDTFSLNFGAPQARKKYGF